MVTGERHAPAGPSAPFNLRPVSWVHDFWSGAGSPGRLHDAMPSGSFRTAGSAGHVLHGRRFPPSQGVGLPVPRQISAMQTVDMFDSRFPNTERPRSREASSIRQCRTGLTAPIGILQGDQRLSYATSAYARAEHRRRLTRSRAASPAVSPTPSTLRVPSRHGGSPRPGGPPSMPPWGPMACAGPTSAPSSNAIACRQIINPAVDCQWHSDPHKPARFMGTPLHPAAGNRS